MKYALRIILFATILAAGVLFFSRDRIIHTLTPSQDDYQYLRLVSEVSAKIERDYVDEINPSEKFPKAYAEMMKSLDNCSSYLNKQKSTLYEIFTSGSFCNFGIYGTISRDYFFITAIREGSSAEKAGLKAGDIIKGIGGESIYSQSFWAIYLALISKEPIEKELVVFRKKSTIPIKIKVKSEKISDSPLVEYPEKDIAYLSINRINSNAVSTIQKELNSGKRIVLDLRNYEGGEIRSVLKTAELLKIKSQITLKYKRRTEELKPVTGDAIDSRQIVAVIDESTIMEHQLLAAMLKKHGVRTVGRKTRAFCSYLKKISFIDDTSIIMTHGIYQIDGKEIFKKGIAPDIRVKSRREFKSEAIKVLKEYNGPEKKER